jgi:uncharacterized protein (TIGR03435 family)
MPRPEGAAGEAGRVEMGPFRVEVRSPKDEGRGRYFRLLVPLLVLLPSSFVPSFTQNVRFEVLSVRANSSGERQASMRWTPAGDFAAVNQPPRVLLQFAYRLPLYRFEGMPDWFTSERFDITGKAPVGLVMEPLLDVRAQLLRGMFEERFRIKARLVTKNVQGMVVTLARSDGRLGPRLRASAKTEAECAAPPASPGMANCGLGGMSSRGPLCGVGVTMAQLTDGLGGAFQRPVVDKTGLTGRYDFELTYTGDGGPGVAFAGRRCEGLTGDQPAFATAFSEQLGLKIESQRVPAEILVIDSAERPADN